VVDLAELETDVPRDAARRQSMLEAQRAAGLRPVIVTPPGANDSAIARTRADEPGVPHVALALPNGFERGRYADVDLQMYAWQAARELRELAPSMVWASSVDGQYRSMLVAMALREHFRIPMVYEVWSLRDAPASGDDESSEEVARAAGQQTRLLRMADAIVAAGEPLCAELVRRGVSPGVISVMSEAASAGQARDVSRGGSAYRFAYEGAIARFGTTQSS
jgi:hypothetical protein